MFAWVLIQSLVEIMGGFAVTRRFGRKSLSFDMF